MGGASSPALRRDDRTAVLETPGRLSARSGVSQTSLIGRRLTRVYDVAGEMPREMHSLLRVLDTKI